MKTSAASFAQTHYSAQELAAMKLPGLPSTERRIRSHAQKNLWVSRSKTRGKGIEYEVNRLPTAVRDAVLQHTLGRVLAQSAPQTSALAPLEPTAPLAVAHPGGLIRRIKTEAELDDTDRERRDAALVLCRAIGAAVFSADCSIKRAITELAERILDGRADPLLVESASITYTKPRKGGQSVAALVSRLQKMYSAFTHGEKSGDVSLYLVPGKSGKRGHVPADIHAFLVHFCRPNQPPVMEAWKTSKNWYAQHGLTQPAVDTWYRIQRELPVTLKYRGRMTGSAYKSLLPYVARDVSMFKSNDLWVGDGHSFKAKIQHPIHGQPYTPEVTVIIDWVSRKIVGWSVDLAESTIAVSAAFRHAQQVTRARPLIYYSDNGSGQCGKHIDAPVTGTLARQGIAHETGIPGNPQGRGIIERLWQVVTIPLARTYPTCTWHGSDKEATRKMLVALNKKDGSRERLLPSFGQFLIDLEAAINDYNSAHTHRELDGLTPDQAYAARLDPDSVDLSITDDELRVQWMPEEVRTPQRGTVSLFGNEYANNELVNLCAEGEKVRVRFDIHNADCVWLYTMQGRYLGEALWNANRKAAFPKPFVEQKRDDRLKGKTQRAERDLREAHAERYGITMENEALIPVVFPEIVPEPELIAVEFAAVESEEEGTWEDTIAMLYMNRNEPDSGEIPPNEVAAR